MKWLAALTICLGGAAAAGAAPGTDPDPDPAPQRVVSINLCADQLAMLIAAPGQIVSVSWLAADPSVSLMPDEARAIGLNDAGAEEVFLQDPDLVLAGPWSDRATVALLDRLGLRVAEVGAADSIADLRAEITAMGALLGQPERAADVLARFDADLAAIPPGRDRLATTYDANGYASGAGTLAGDVMRRAGLRLLSGDLRISTGQVPLERLVMAAPELIVTGDRYGGQSQAEAILDHPAFAAVTARRVHIPDRDWICGLPAIAGTVERLTR